MPRKTVPKKKKEREKKPPKQKKKKPPKYTGITITRGSFWLFLGESWDGHYLVKSDRSCDHIQNNTVLT